MKAALETAVAPPGACVPGDHGTSAALTVTVKGTLGCLEHQCKSYATAPEECTWV